MNRRDTLAALLALGAVPLVALAQEGARSFRVGFIVAAARPQSLESSAYGGFTKGMRELGYVEGKHFVMEWRFAEGNYERFPDLAAELVRLKVDVIVLSAGLAAPAAKRATATIPIVIGTATDPVRSGFVASLSRPGGNITGLSSTSEVYVKCLDLLKNIVPGATRVAVLVNPGNPGHIALLEMLHPAARTVGVTILPVNARSQEEIERGFAQMKRERAQGLIVPSDSFFFKQRSPIAELAARNRLPSIYSSREYVEAGGLMSYGQPLSEFYRHAAAYVDKIFKGANPGDLPVEQPTRFEMAINGRIAKELSIKIPSELLLRADEVIE